MIDKYIQDWLDIIENMSNDNTYKLAWGRSILETLNEKDIDGDITISFDELSPKIIKYYWNQIYFFNLTQGPSKKPVIEQKVKILISKYQSETGRKNPEWYEKAESHFIKNKEEYNNIVQSISSVLLQNVSWRFMNVNGGVLPVYKLDKKNRMIAFTREQAISLKDYSFALSQLLSYRWAQLLELFNTSPRIASKVKGLSDNKIRRKSLSKYKNILLKANGGNAIDFYTGKILKENDISVDHVIPWSFMYSDDIWNLVLTSKTNNSAKSNNIPSKEIIAKLKERNRELVHYVSDSFFEGELVKANEDNYVDKFYNSLKY